MIWKQQKETTTSHKHGYGSVHIYVLVVSKQQKETTTPFAVTVPENSVIPGLL
jgi:ppGpp synthetase/RelA/SpoT-type nucleotidyltranferase